MAVKRVGRQMPTVAASQRGHGTKLCNFRSRGRQCGSRHAVIRL